MNIRLSGPGFAHRARSDRCLWFGLVLVASLFLTASCAKKMQGNECDDGNDENWDGCNSGLISEYRVHPEPGRGRMHPVLAVLASGEFLVAWDEAGIGAQAFAADGQRAGEPIVLPSRRGQLIGAASLGDRYLLVWPGQLPPQTGESDDHQSTRFLLKEEEKRAEAALQNCKSRQPDNWISRCRGERRALDVARKAGPLVATVVSGGGAVEFDEPVSIVQNADLDFRPVVEGGIDRAAIAWGGSVPGRAADLTSACFAMVIRAGSLRTFEPVRLHVGAAGSCDHVGLAWLQNGKLLAVWGGSAMNALHADAAKQRVLGRVLTEEGSPLGDVLELAVGGEPSVVALQGGGFALAWHQAPQREGAPWTAEAQLFDADGDRVGGQFQIGPYSKTPNFFGGPLLARLNDGTLAAVYLTETPDPSGPFDNDIHFRLFTPEGKPSTKSAAPHLHLAGNHEWPALAVLPNGDFIVAWGAYNTGVASDIFMQRVSSAGKRTYWFK